MCIRDSIQSVHGADDAAYADSVARFAQLRPHHLEGIAKLQQHFWLGSSDADASLVPYPKAIKALSHLSATYSTRRKLALLIDVLQLIQHHVWNYYGIASPEDRANDMRLRLAADDLLPVVAYVLSQARPVLHICSELAFIELFADDGCLLGEHGYCLATFQAASKFLRTLTWPQIELGNQNAVRPRRLEAKPLTATELTSLPIAPATLATRTPVGIGQRNHLHRGHPFETPSSVGAATTPMTSTPRPLEHVPPPPPDGEHVPPPPPPPPDPPPHLMTPDKSTARVSTLITSPLERARATNLGRRREGQPSRFTSAVMEDQWIASDQSFL